MTTVISLVAGILAGGFIYAQVQPAPAAPTEAAAPAETPSAPSIWRNSLNESDRRDIDMCRARYEVAAYKCIERLCSKRAARFVVPTEERAWTRRNDEDANCAMACYYTMFHTNYHQSCLVRGVE